MSASSRITTQGTSSVPLGYDAELVASKHYLGRYKKLRPQCITNK